MSWYRSPLTVTPLTVLISLKKKNSSITPPAQKPHNTVISMNAFHALALFEGLDLIQQFCLLTNPIK